jgi:hypothetical protein
VTDQAKIIGYEFGPYVKCPICVGLTALGSVTASGRDREPPRTAELERILDMRAKHAGFNREDETSFDSAKDFPKRVREGDEREGEECAQCGAALGTVGW